jgi:hypothetical protein
LNMDADEKLRVYRDTQNRLSAEGRRVSLTGTCRKGRSCPQCYRPIRKGVDIINVGKVDGFWRWVCVKCAPSDPGETPHIKSLVAAQLVEKLQDLDISLVREGDKLLCRGKGARLPEEIREQIRACRTELLDLLVVANKREDLPAVVGVPVEPTLVRGTAAEKEAPTGPATDQVPVEEELFPEEEEPEYDYILKSEPGAIAVYWHFDPSEGEPVIVTAALMGMSISEGALLPVVVEPGTGKLLVEPDCLQLDSRHEHSTTSVQLLGYDQEDTFDEEEWLELVLVSPEYRHWVGNWYNSPYMGYYGTPNIFYLEDCPAHHRPYTEEYPYDSNRCDHCREYMHYISSDQPPGGLYEHLYEFCTGCGCVYHKGNLMYQDGLCAQRAAAEYRQRVTPLGL